MSRASDDLMMPSYAHAGITPDRDPTGEIVRRGKVIAERELQIQALREANDRLTEELERVEAENERLMARLRGETVPAGQGEDVIDLKIQLTRYRIALKALVELL